MNEEHILPGLLVVLLLKIYLAGRFKNLIYIMQIEDFSRKKKYSAFYLIYLILRTLFDLVACMGIFFFFFFLSFLCFGFSIFFLFFVRPHFAFPDNAKFRYIPYKLRV